MRFASRFDIKVAGAFLVVLLAVGGAGLFAITRLASAASQREALARQRVDNLVLAERLRSAEVAVVAAGRGFLVTQNHEFLVRHDIATEELWQALSTLRVRLGEGNEAEQLVQIRAMAERFTQAQQQLISSVSEGLPPGEVKRAYEERVVPHWRGLREATDSLVARIELALRAGEAESHALTRRTSVGAMAVLLVAVLAASLLAALLGRNLAATYRKEAEAKQLASQALSARDEVLGIVAHDLRSPLSAIAMKAALVRRGSTEDKTRRDASLIESIAMRMDVLIAGLLDSASIDSATLNVRPAPCEVQVALQEVVNELSTLASPKSIVLVVHDEPGLAVMADRARLTQVLHNVIGNAIKFSFEGGTVDVSAGRVGDDVRFSVADSGPGIAPSHLPRLFERFWRGEPGGKRGTGLGLYIAKGLVEAHGGRIWVESRIGHGATFFFTFPFTPLPAAPAEEAGARQTH